MPKNQKKVKINIFDKSLTQSISFYLKDLHSASSSESEGMELMDDEIKPSYNLHLHIQLANASPSNLMDVNTNCHYIYIAKTKANEAKFKSLVALLQGNKKWQEFIRPSSGLGKEVILNFKFEHEE